MPVESKRGIPPGELTTRDLGLNSLRHFLLNVSPEVNRETHLILPGKRGNGPWRALMTLRECFPRQRQEELLVRFYSEVVRDFPNGEEVGRMLARINNISWFSPEIAPDRQTLKGLAKEHRRRLNDPEAATRLVKIPGLRKGALTYPVTEDDALDKAWSASSEATKKSGWPAKDARHEIYRLTHFGLITPIENSLSISVFGSVTRKDPEYLLEESAATRVADLLYLYTSWPMLADALKARGYAKGNPFEPLIEIFEMGAHPAGLDKDGNYLVLVPTEQLFS